MTTATTALSTAGALTVFAFCLLALADPSTTHAHLKWFCDFSFADTRSPSFWVLTALSMILIGALVFLDVRPSRLERRVVLPAHKLAGSGP